MKKIAVGIAVVLGLTFLVPASANVTKSIVIIDTAIDSTRPEFKDRLIYEVCILQSFRCPNGQFFQEGAGAATLPVNQAYANGFDHGSIMSSIATQVDPGVKFVFIRIAGMTRSGTMDAISDTQVTKALDWVIANKEKYNIVSVSSSLGSSALRPGTNYCPIKPTHSTLIANINRLIALGVPTIFPSGNSMNLTKIDFPACIASSVAVSAVNEKTVEGYRIAPYANTGPDVDFYALGSFNNPIKRSVGTSAAAVAFSTYWSKMYKGTYQSTYDYMKSISKPAENTKVKTTTFVDILG